MNRPARRLLILRGAFRLLPRALERADPRVQRRVIGRLAARAFEAASPAERSRFIETLIRPLGLLSVAAVANGVFTPWRLGGAGGAPHVPVEEATQVQPRDLAALVEHALQVGAETLDGLAGVLAASPVVGTCSAAALLLAALAWMASRRARPAAGSDFEP